MISQQEDLLEVSDSIDESEEKWKRIEKILNEGFIAIDLVEEYGGASSYVGEKTFAIATNLSEEKLLATFSNELQSYKPYIVITGAMYKAIKVQEFNDERERKREALYHDSFANLDIYLIDEMSNPVQICESIQTLNYIFDKIETLPDNQGPRIYKRFILGFTAREIAQEEGVTTAAIRSSVRFAKRSIYKVFVRCGVVDKNRHSFYAYSSPSKGVAA